MRSLIRIKRYHDTVVAQASELRAWNAQLEARVTEQVTELERVNRLRRFLSPPLVDLIVDSGDESMLGSHRREIVVLFCDLRGFTAFAEVSEPEEVMAVLSEYHAANGDLIHRFEGTLERFTGDGLMVFFNDPVLCDDAPLRAIRMAVAMRSRVQDLTRAWAVRGHDLGFAVGIAQGFATMGRIGFEGRFDYAAIGSVTNLASRLCGRARADQILVTQRVHAAARRPVASVGLGPMSLKGFSRDTHVYDIWVSTQHRCPVAADSLSTRESAMTLTTSSATLSSLDEDQRYEYFDRLQARLPQVWERMRLNEEGESVVVVPSVTLDRVTTGSGSLAQAMEERYLFLLLLLREPRLRMIYVTSMTVDPAIIEYYLACSPASFRVTPALGSRWCR